VEVPRKAVRLRVAEAAEAAEAAPTMKESILAVAGRMFSTHSFDRTTTRMLADELGVNVATLYYHFADKQSLFFHYLEQLLLKLVKTVGGAVNASGMRPRDQLAAFARAHVRFQVEERGVASLYAMRGVVLADAPAEYQKRLSAVERKHYQLLRRIIQNGIRDDGFSVDALAPAVFAIFAIGEHAPTWFRENGSMGPAALAEAYARIALRIVGVPESMPPPNKGGGQ
jgi:AcrR family transcriptional regulator